MSDPVSWGMMGMSAFSAFSSMSGAGAASKQGASNAVASAMGAGRQAAAERFGAEEAQRVGRVVADNTLAQAAEFKGSQRVLAAAQGFAYDGGTVAVLQEQTENLARADALATLQDAGHKYVSGMASADNLIKNGVSQAVAINEDAQNQAKAMRNQAFSSLLGGFSTFATSKTGSNLFNSFGSSGGGSGYNSSSTNTFHSFDTMTG
jgi:hypothetical protein